MKTPEIRIIAAVGKHRELGYKGKLLWSIPEDLKRFKELTLGHPVIMGQTTFESIIGYLGKPFPGRTSVVISADPAYAHDGAIITHTIDEALEKAKGLDSEVVYVGGGASIYKQMLQHADSLYLTMIDDSKEADVFFPEFETEFTKLVSEQTGESNGLRYKWVVLNRG